MILAVKHVSFNKSIAQNGADEIELHGKFSSKLDGKQRDPLKGTPTLPYACKLFHGNALVFDYWDFYISSQNL